MNKQQKKQLDRYSMMIVSKYLKNISDFIKMIKICKKFEEIPSMFHYNPVKLIKKTKLFPNIETYHIYDKNEKRIEGYDKYVCWYEVDFETYLNKKENEEYKSVLFTLSDWNNYKSFKGATILCKSSLSQCDFTEIDLTGISKLKSYCFNQNTSIKRVKLDKRISTIPNDCFSVCSSLVELDLSYVKILGHNCFGNCHSLTALTLPEMLFQIENFTFYGLNNLEKIETNGIKLIESNMNYSTYKSFKRNGIEVKGDISFNSYDRDKYGNEIPEGVSIINSNCFNNVTTLGDVILPKSVTKLDYYCFDNCSIKSIDLSNVIENKCAFYACDQLTSITLSKINIESIENVYELFYNYLTTLKNIELSDTNHIPIVSNHLRKLMDEKGYKYDNCIYTQNDLIATNSIVPDEVNVVDSYVFYDLSELKTITIPPNVTQILSNNFNQTSNLECIEVKSTNLRCDACCFNGLPRIKELDLRGITSFGSNCICHCSSLSRLIIHNIALENGVMGCELLKEIEIIGIENNEYEHPIDYKLANILENKGIHCKRKVFIKYESGNIEETYCIPDGVNEIASYSFQYGLLKELTIPSSVTLIKSYSFFCNYYLTHLIIQGNPEINRNAFNGCSLLIQNQPDLKQYS